MFIDQRIFKIHLLILVVIIPLIILGCAVSEVVPADESSEVTPTAVSTVTLATTSIAAEVIATVTSPPTQAPVPTAESSPTLRPTAVPEPNYEDEVLQFTAVLPEGWSAEHQNGTTIVKDGGGKPIAYVRDYVDRGGFIATDELINRSLPPDQPEDPIVDHFSTAFHQVYVTNYAFYIRTGGRLLSIAPVQVDNRLAVEAIVQTVSAQPTAFNDNYNLLTSHDWIAEVRGGANYTETFTIQRFDGTAGYTLLVEPPTEGLGYDLIYPLFFSEDGHYLFYQNQGIADGCGLFFGGGNVQRVDLRTGETYEFIGSNGDGPTISPDGTTIAIMRNQTGNELVLYDLGAQTSQTIALSLQGETPLAGSPLWSPNGGQVAFAAQERFCGEGWTIGVVDLETEALTLYPVLINSSPLSFYRPAQWLSEGLVLNYWDGEDIYLEFESGNVFEEVPSASVGVDD